MSNKETKKSKYCICYIQGSLSKSVIIVSNEWSKVKSKLKETLIELTNIYNNGQNDLTEKFDYHFNLDYDCFREAEILYDLTKKIKNGGLCKEHYKFVFVERMVEESSALSFDFDDLCADEMSQCDSQDFSDDCSDEDEHIDDE